MANKKKEDNLIGTLYASLGVGLVIILVWAYAFGLFTDRF